MTKQDDKTVDSHLENIKSQVHFMYSNDIVNVYGIMVPILLDPDVSRRHVVMPNQ